MVNRGTNHLGIDKSKTAGGRKRRNASQRKRRLADQNLYTIRVSHYGLVRCKSVWKLMALTAEQRREKLVSDRRGGTTTETVKSGAIRGDNPKMGIQVDTFDTKKDATSEYYTPDSWTRFEPGSYYGTGSYRTFEVDRDEWSDWIRSRDVGRP